MCLVKTLRVQFCQQIWRSLHQSIFIETDFRAIFSSIVLKLWKKAQVSPIDSSCLTQFSIPWCYGFLVHTTTSSFSDAPLTNFLAELKGLTFNNVKKSRKTLNGKVLCCKGLLLRNFFCHAKGWKRKTFAKVLSCSSLIHICLVQVEVYKSVLIDWLADEKRTE